MNAHFATRPFGSGKMQSGFSLIELMIVIGIIGILATLATPRLRTFQARARQAETKTGLNQVFALQTIFHDDPVNGGLYAAGAAVIPLTVGWLPAVVPTVDTCLQANPLGFRINDCAQTRYIYSVDISAAPATGFVARAVEFNQRVSGVAACAFNDTETIDQNSVRTHPNATNSVTLCM